ncbi:ATP-binding protein, partial [Chloroflexota bacterium]
DNMPVNTQIIDLETAIVNLYKQSKQFETASEDIGGVNADITRRVSDTNVQIRKLGEKWTAEGVKNFNFDLVQEDRCRTAKNRITTSEREIENINTKLDAHTESKAAKTPPSTSVSLLIRVIGYISAALGAGGIAAGLLLSQPGVSAVSAILFLVGLVLSLSGRRPGLSSMPDELESKYRDNLASAESDLKGISEGWQVQLRNAGLNEDLSPDGALDAVRTIMGIQSELKLIADLDARSKAMQEVIDSVNKRLNEVDSTLGKKRTSDGAIDRIEELSQQLEGAKIANNRKEGVDREIKKREKKIHQNQELLKTVKDELAVHISSAGVTDGEQFKQKFELFKKREELKEEIEHNRTTIQKVVGSGEYYERFIESVSKTDPVTLKAEGDAQEERLKEWKSERAEITEKIGELRGKLEDLSTRDLGEEQTDLEVKIQNLRDYSMDWVRARIATFVLDKAISKYENTRQPEVIKAATGVFKKITADAYQMIIKPTGTDEVVIQDFSQKRKTVRQMSRGTKEQLYFAMRLGLISTAEAKSEPMPIIMDDILVNFDDDRGLATVEGLVEFSEKRQVLILTCHKGTFEVYKKLGANQIDFD